MKKLLLVILVLGLATASANAVVTSWDFGDATISLSLDLAGNVIVTGSDVMSGSDADLQFGVYDKYALS